VSHLRAIPRPLAFRRLVGDLVVSLASVSNPPRLDASAVEICAAVEAVKFHSVRLEDVLPTTESHTVGGATDQ
jgi:hypothetical protein